MHPLEGAYSSPRECGKPAVRMLKTKPPLYQELYFCAEHWADFLRAGWTEDAAVEVTAAVRAAIAQERLL